MERPRLVRKAVAVRPRSLGGARALTSRPAVYQRRSVESAFQAAVPVSVDKAKEEDPEIVVIPVPLIAAAAVSQLEGRAPKVAVLSLRLRLSRYQSRPAAQTELF